MGVSVDSISPFILLHENFSRTSDVRIARFGIRIAARYLLMPNLPRTSTLDLSGVRAERLFSARPPLVLVVEDHEDTCFLFRTLLEMRGLRVAEAHDGEDGVRQAEALRPDLILMDSGLPRMDGMAAMRGIRERAELCRVPIIFISGHAHPAHRAAALAAGCDEYLVKPIELRVLERVIQKHLNWRGPLALVKDNPPVYEGSDL
ncbi:hypothetical protein BH18ACI2_BH18ACI2_24320 [soil metagenome]